jgi:predicted RNA-binding protein with PIN domain
MSSGGCTVTDRIPLPDALLVPIVESAGDTIRALDATEIPSALRHLQSFDKRGFLHGPAPRQVRAALEKHTTFRETVVTRFCERPEVRAILDGWTAERAIDVVEDAEARGDLPLLASVLWAAEPAGHAYGLGIVHARFEQRVRDDARRSDAQSSARELAAAEEAKRRADAARMAAQTELERVEGELRDERRARRAREEDAEADVAAARRTAEGATAQLAQANAATAAAEGRATREARRAQDLERDLRAARDELDRVRAQGVGLAGDDARALAGAADAARKLAATLDGVAKRASVAAEGPARGAGRRSKAAPSAAPRAPARRTSPTLPAGMVADSAPGAEAMLRTPGVALVVDGYNVAKRAWPDATPGDQRERLALALAALHARTGASSTVVFDGDAAGGATVPVLRRRGLKVLFSEAGEEADDVVVREVARLPKRVPVVVASSDAWVREHAEQAGAVVIAAATLLAVAR